MSEIATGEGGVTPEAVESSPVETENTGQAEGANEAQEPAKQEKERTFSQAEMDAAIAKRIAKERRRFERETRSLMHQQAADKQEEPKAPNRADFDNNDDYLEAKAGWIAEQRASQHIAQVMSVAQQREADRDFLERAGDVVEKGREAFKDFDEVINAAANEGVIQIGSALHKAIVSEDDGHKLAYHLAKHPDEALRIGELSQTKQMIELGKLSARLEKSVSKAPKPPTPIEGGTGKTDSDWMSRSPRQILKDRQKARGR